MMPRVKLFCSFILLFASQSALAVSYPLPPEGESSGRQPADDNRPGQ
ncbi:Probable L,D-transpeptidase ErfK/SrfK precursor [Citrobacter koseri]|nr:Probable L,D-transpeptidase ErfK/SrfK precursor [Citrobacter koseri]